MSDREKKIRQLAAGRRGTESVKRVANFVWKMFTVISMASLASTSLAVPVSSRAFVEMSVRA